MSSQQVVTFHSSKIKPVKLGFEWSLRPLIVLNRFIGIQLDLQSDNCNSLKERSIFQQIFRWMIIIFGFLLFFLNAECNFVFAGDYIHNALMAKNNTKISTTLTWNEVIVFFNGAVTLVGTHAIFIAFSMINWRHLVKLFLVMEKQNLFNRKDYQKFRHVCSASVVVFILEAVLQLVVTLLCWPSASSVIFKLQHFQTHLSPMYFFSGICLFVSLGGIACTMLDIVGKQVKSHCDREKFRHENDFWHRQLFKWKIQYYFIHELVHQINQCFGCFLLVVLTSYFVRMINISFIFLNCFRQTLLYSPINIGLYTFFLVQDFINFSGIVYLPYLIKQKAKNLNKKLRKLCFDDDTALQKQVDCLKIEISLSLPQITAAGLFDLDCQLVPTFLGTTLTYLIILYQFEAFENKVLTSS